MLSLVTEVVGVIATLGNALAFDKEGHRGVVVQGR